MYRINLCCARQAKRHSPGVTEGKDIVNIFLSQLGINLGETI